LKRGVKMRKGGKGREKRIMVGASWTLREMDASGIVQH